MNKPMKIFAAFFAGNLVFIFLYAAVRWFVSRLVITPYGRFMAEFFKDRTPEQAQAYIDSNRSLYDIMMPEAARFSSLVLTPSGGLVMGLVIGLLIATRDRTTALVWSLISVMPITVFFLAVSAGDPYRAQSLLLLVAAVMAGGFIGNAVSTRAPAGRGAEK